MRERGAFQLGYFEKQLCICVSKGMSTVAEEEHTPVSHVLVLLFLPKVLLDVKGFISAYMSGLSPNKNLQLLTFSGKMNSTY